MTDILAKKELANVELMNQVVFCFVCVFVFWNIGGGRLVRSSGRWVVGVKEEEEEEEEKGEEEKEEERQ